MRKRWCILVFALWGVGCLALDWLREPQPAPAACESANPGAGAAPVERCKSQVME